MTLKDLLEKWLGKEGGAERANYQMFLTELTIALGLPTPHAKGMGLGDYEFEAPVRSEAIYGGKGTKRIDLYKRGHFILEAKQSQVREGEALPDDPADPPQTETEFDLFGAPVRTVQKTSKPRRRYDRLMEDARLQAQRYALALPDDHETPPFLIVADIGRAFELYFDFAGNGRGYRPFPDERGYRIALADLASEAEIAGAEKTAADILRAIWTEPASIDPRLKAAKVTREVATRLSRVAEHLEQIKRQERPGAADHHLALGIEETSLFVMRLLFCMFAEDVGLLPKGSFTALLIDAKEVLDSNEQAGVHHWRSSLESLWRMMDQDGEPRPYWLLGRALVRHFNGNLFKDKRVYPLAPEFLGELIVAAKKEWKNVEPAIFGTLLEQVLTANERAKLGAHYTPRPYVQRLVQATVMDVLEAEWERVSEAARAAADAGDSSRAIDIACRYHAGLADLRVLDPACGTGNFLYVAMENLLRLESEVRQFVIALGGELAPGVHPNQFLGLELNPRAAVIAELVLWIGWLRFRLANTPEAIGEPVLPPLSNINEGMHGGFDAVLVRTMTGEPDTEDPRRPEWPEADFIVGNPPFIGGKDIRDRLGGAYAEALWKANPRVPKSADFVMHWWDRAADILTRPGARLRRFGFVTTNSITQVFSRRVIEGWLAAEIPPPPGEGDHPQDGRGAPAASATSQGSSTPPVPLHPQPLAGGPPPRAGEEKLHLTLAIADHPWTRATKDAAAVRIAMTVAEAGPGEGRLVDIVREAGLDSDEPELEERVALGRINADLSLGTDLTKVVSLKASEGLCSPGVKLHGAGFIVSQQQARELGLGRRPGLEAHIRDYRNGRDLLQRPRGAMVIDLFGLSEQEVMERFPEVYQHVRKTVYEKTWNPKANKGKGAWEGREVNNRPSYKELWWIFGEPRRDLRPALEGLPRFIGTTETSKHRVFNLLEGVVLPDNMIVVIAADDLAAFGVLSSKIHEEWALERGATLEDRPRYTKSQVIDPFPFPDPSDAVAEIGKQLDAARRAALAENPALTMTGLYNFVAPIREGALPSEQEAAATRARAFIVAKLHDDLDQAVADAYGWGEEWRRAPLPPAEIVRRLVALNAARAKEEAKGQVRWLRPGYQKPRFGAKK